MEEDQHHHFILTGDVLRHLKTRFDAREDTSLFASLPYLLGLIQECLPEYLEEEDRVRISTALVPEVLRIFSNIQAEEFFKKFLT